MLLKIVKLTVYAISLWSLARNSSGRGEESVAKDEKILRSGELKA
jgi:hypothetical protein